VPVGMWLNFLQSTQSQKWIRAEYSGLRFICFVIVVIQSVNCYFEESKSRHYSVIQKDGLNFISLYFKIKTSDKCNVNYI